MSESSKTWYVEYERKSLDGSYNEWSTFHVVQGVIEKEAILRACHLCLSKHNTSWEDFLENPRLHTFLEDLEIEGCYAWGYLGDTQVELSVEKGDEFALEIASEIKRLLGIEEKEKSHRIILDDPMYIEVNLPKLVFSTGIHRFHKELADPRSLTLEWLQEQIKQLILLRPRSFAIGKYRFTLEGEVKVTDVEE